MRKQFWSMTVLALSLAGAHLPAAPAAREAAIDIKGYRASVAFHAGVLELTVRDRAGQPLAADVASGPVELTLDRVGKKSRVLKADHLVAGAAGWPLGPPTHGADVAFSLSVELGGKRLQGQGLWHVDLAGAKAKQGWTCTMDGYHSDKPGHCPLCGMDLVPADSAD